MEREGGRESVADLFGHSLTAKGGNGGCLSMGGRSGQGGQWWTLMVERFLVR